MTLDLSRGEKAFQPLEAELQKLNKNIYLPLIGCNDAPDAKPFILQRWSTEWQEYVDLQSALEIYTGDKLLAVPQPQSVHSGTTRVGHSVS